jgi:hypothetical protein
VDDVGLTSAIALGVGAVSLAAAAIGVLLRRTQGATGIRRTRLMARLAAAALWGVFPPRWAVAAVTAGLLAFAGTLAAGLAVTVLIVRAIPPAVPNPTEAYEGFGDAMMAQFRFCMGAGLSLLVACITGCMTGDWAASRWGRGAGPNKLLQQTGHAIDGCSCPNVPPA